MVFSREYKVFFGIGYKFYELIPIFFVHYMNMG